MRVLINALSARQGGGQTYLYNLLSNMPADGDLEVFLLVPPSFRLSVAHPRVRRIDSGASMENAFLRAAWEHFGLPRLIRKLGADVLFCPGGIIGTRPPEACRTVTMFRNMIPFDPVQTRKYGMGYQRWRNWLLQQLMLRSMIAADLVIFVSHYAKQVVEKRVPGRIRQAVVIAHGIGSQFRAHRVSLPPRPAWLPTQSYLLYVSTLDVYKAQIEVVQAFALLRQRRPTEEILVLAGPENPAYGRQLREEIARLCLERSIWVAGPVPYADLPAAYRHALINLFASESENCPNILLESLAAGRPILCSNAPPMPEFAGDAVLYFDPRSPADLAARLHSLIDEPERMVELGRRAEERSQLYSWGSTARHTWNAIHELVRGQAMRQS